MMLNNRHVPVLLDEVIGGLALRPGARAIDCTLGDAGHTEAMLAHVGSDGKVLGVDADPESLLRAKQLLYDYGDQVVFVRDNFDHLADIVMREDFAPVNAILFDLGWSTPQFEERGRGFSFQFGEEPLDMRYDTRMDCVHAMPEEEIDRMREAGEIYYGKCTAAELVNMHEEEELVRIFHEYGEENLSVEIAKEIVETRKKYDIETVKDLVEIILRVYREKLKTDKEVPWVGGLHPATKIFQALRIVVNEELGVVERALPQAIDVLAPGGRLAVISFHSLEDRIVKHFFKSQHGKTVQIITKKPIVCSEKESKENPRARSAKLRVIEKI